MEHLEFEVMVVVLLSTMDHGKSPFAWANYKDLREGHPKWI